MPRQLWIPKVLRDAGLTVYEEDGWETRGAASFNPIGVMWHHTATPPSWSSRQLTDLLVRGHASLRGPLCQLQLNRDGVYVVVAAGRANHAGRGSWPTIRLGNTQTIGIEAANNGVGEPWPEEQVDAYIRGTAAILKHLGQPVQNVVGHKEWAPSRKIDPRGLDMDEMRLSIQNVENPPIVVPNAKNPVLQYNSTGESVRRAQRLLTDHGVNVGTADGEFGPRTYAGVKRFQAEKGLKNDGIIESLTWSKLDKAPARPTVNKAKINDRCKRQVLKRGSRGVCVSSLQRALNSLGHKAGTPDGVFGPSTDNAVKSFQRFNRIKEDGVVGPTTWSKL